MSGRRRFFSGTSESQAAIEAATALGVPVTELAYRAVDKRGALRPGRVVIEVDPDNPRRAAEVVAPAASEQPAGSPSLARAAAPPAQAGGGGPSPRTRREDERGGWSPRPHRDAPVLEDVVLAVAGPEDAAELLGAAGAAEAARALVALADLELAAKVEVADDTVRVDLEGPARDALVGRRGELLHSFEYLLRRMVRDLPEGGLTADSGGFRAQREDELRRRAAAAAAEVRSSGEPVTFEPLNAAERRIVHLVVQDEAGVASASEGDGETKRVRVFRAP